MGAPEESANSFSGALSIVAHSCGAINSCLAAFSWALAFATGTSGMALIFAADWRRLAFGAASPTAARRFPDAFCFAGICRRSINYLRALNKYRAPAARTPRIIQTGGNGPGRYPLKLEFAFFSGTSLSKRLVKSAKRIRSLVEALDLAFGATRMKRSEGLRELRAASLGGLILSLSSWLFWVVTFG